MVIELETEFEYKKVKLIEFRTVEMVYGWLVNFFLLISIMGIICFQLMHLTDLQFDYLNPYDSAWRINIVIWPEYMIQGILCLTFLLTGHWCFCLLSLPYLYYNLTLYLQRRHLVDVTEIYNQLNREKQMRIYKLGYLVILLALCVFWFLWTFGED